MNRKVLAMMSSVLIAILTAMPVKPFAYHLMNPGYGYEDGLVGGLLILAFAIAIYCIGMLLSTALIAKCRLSPILSCATILVASLVNFVLAEAPYHKILLLGLTIPIPDVPTQLTALLLLLGTSFTGLISIVEWLVWRNVFAATTGQRK